MCFIDGSFVFYSPDNAPSLPNPLTALDVNFWWKERGGEDRAIPFWFRQWRQPVPVLVPRIGDDTYYFLSETNYDYHFGHAFLDGIFAAFRAYELFGIDKIPESKLKIASADPEHCWAHRKDCGRNWQKVLAITSQKDIEIFESNVCFQHLLMGSGMGSFMTIENTSTIANLRDFVLKKLGLPKASKDRFDANKICVRETRKPPMCGRIILNFDEVVRKLKQSINDVKVQVIGGWFDKVSVFVYLTCVFFKSDPFKTLKDEIEELSTCGVLISQEGGAGALNMFMSPGSTLITIDFMYQDGESRTYDGSFYHRLNWMKHLRYTLEEKDLVVHFNEELRNSAPTYGVCQDFNINFERMIKLVN